MNKLDIRCVYSEGSVDRTKKKKKETDKKKIRMKFHIYMKL